MSMMNRLDVDLTELGEKAVNAAGLATPAERIDALTSVFEECGERANAYYCPEDAARHLVQWVVMDYQIARDRAVVYG